MLFDIYLTIPKVLVWSFCNSWVVHCWQLGKVGRTPGVLDTHSRFTQTGGGRVSIHHLSIWFNARGYFLCWINGFNSYSGQSCPVQSGFRKVMLDPPPKSEICWKNLRPGQCSDSFRIHSALVWIELRLGLTFKYLTIAPFSTFANTALPSPHSQIESETSSLVY